MFNKFVFYYSAAQNSFAFYYSAVHPCSIKQQSSNDDACDDTQVSVGAAIHQVWKVWKENPM